MDELFSVFQVRAIVTYMRVTKLLLKLTLPIVLEPYEAGMSPAEMVEGVEHAREILIDLPLDETVYAAVNTVILDWLSGMVLATLGAIEETEWMVKSAIFAMHRVDVAVDLATGLIDGTVEILDETDDKE